jgi:O-Antigen ligase
VSRAAGRAFVPAATAAAVGVATFCLAYDDGGYSLAARSALAIGVWWAILIGAVLGVWRLGPAIRAAVVPAALLAALAVWDLASTGWASSAEGAFDEFDRTSLYVGIYVLVVLAARRDLLRAWIDGLVLGIAATGIVALVSRLFPGTFPARSLLALLPSAATRLSFPLDYWNGLGIFLGLGFPLLYHSAMPGSRIRRACALAVLPALGVAVYLTSSRGAVLAIGLGTVVFVVAHPRRWAAIGTVALSGVGVAVAVGLTATRHTLVDGPLASAAARSEGRQVALAVVLVGLATAAVAEGATWLASRLPTPGPRVRRIAAIAILVGGIGVVAAEARSFRDFTRLPPASAAGNSVGAHLLSGSGSGRWQFWTAAFDEFRSSPLHGGGAGSFETWWARHASFSYFVRDAHSLLLQTLAELGIVGFLLLLAFLATGLTVAVRRLLAAGGGERAARAALLGAFAVYLVGASLDWMWELTAVTAVGLCTLALLDGRATASPSAEHAASSGVARACLAAVACLLLAAETLALLTDVEIGGSQAAARAGNLVAARADAIAATRLEPWAASPYLQLALVEESRGDLKAASRAVLRSASRNADDWRPWLIAARIEDGQGETRLAAAHLARARALDPRSVVTLEATR